jgi:hypothetical protein
MVVNACGGCVDLRASDNNVYSNLWSTESASFNIFGTLDQDIETFRGVRTKEGDRLYTCGPPAFGNLLIVDTLASIVKHSKIIAGDIFNRIKSMDQTLFKK